jgi:hypothetical protein
MLHADRPAAQAIIRRIRANNRRHAIAILKLALKTVLPPSVTLAVLALLSAYLVGYIQVTFGSRLLTAAASAVTFLVAILIVRSVWQWADRRYGGWTLLRTVGQVNRDIRQLERSIYIGAMTEAEYVMAAQAAWEMYAAAMQHTGFQVE